MASVGHKPSSIHLSLRLPEARSKNGEARHAHVMNDDHVKTKEINRKERIQLVRI